jgi:hypothetical protein
MPLYSVSTTAYGINNSGQIVGTYSDGTGGETDMRKSCE